jgi:Ca2+-binding EF-hand superfamily protein
MKTAFRLHDWVGLVLTTLTITIFFTKHKLQDDDGFISKKDMVNYLSAVTNNGYLFQKDLLYNEIFENLFLFYAKLSHGACNSLGSEDVDKIIDNLFSEFSPDTLVRGISYMDFQQVVSLMDFHSKLQLPL